MQERAFESHCIVKIASNISLPDAVAHAAAATQKLMRRFDHCCRSSRQ